MQLTNEIKIQRYGILRQIHHLKLAVREIFLSDEIQEKNVITKYMWQKKVWKYVVW